MAPKICSEFLQPVLDAYNTTKHPATGVAPNHE